MRNAGARALLVPVALVALVATLGVPGAGGLEGFYRVNFPSDPPSPVAAVEAANTGSAGVGALSASVPLAAMTRHAPEHLVAETTPSKRTPGRPSVAPRGALFTTLAVSFVGLQALDVHSTLFAIDRGAGEINPMMAPFASHPAALIAVKAGAAGGILFMVDRIRARNRLAGVLMMAAANSAYATVVANNYRIARRATR